MASARPPRPRYVEITWGDAVHCPHPDLLSELEGDVYLLVSRTTAPTRARLPRLLYVGDVAGQRQASKAKRPHPVSGDIREHLVEDRRRWLHCRSGQVRPIEEPLSPTLVEDVVEGLIATNAPLFNEVVPPRPRQQGIVLVNKGTFLPLIAKARCG